MKMSTFMEISTYYLYFNVSNFIRRLNIGQINKRNSEAESILSALIIILMPISTHLNGIKLIQIAVIIKSLVNTY